MNGISGRQVKIQRNNLPAGVYLIRLTSENSSHTARIIITD